MIGVGKSSNPFLL